MQKLACTRKEEAAEATAPEEGTTAAEAAREATKSESKLDLRAPWAPTKANINFGDTT